MKFFILFWCLFLGWTLPNVVQSKRVGSRIIGGQLARSGQFPFAAAIYTTTAEGSYFCGGTLLNARWILTAGQCVDGVQTFIILLGTNRLNGNDPHRVRVSSDTYVLHPDYDARTLDNDIGLISLRMPVEYNDYLKPVDFLPTEALSDYTPAMAIGWGQTSDDESGLADELRWVDVTSVTEQECKLTYGQQVTDSMVCVDGSHNQGTCFGDSGGPLVKIVGMERTIVVGIASFFSANGCESTDPSGFTRIFPYNDWIKSITGRAS